MVDSRLSPVLLALMEHEKIIEQADAMAEACKGWAYREIRDQRLYKAVHRDFDTYCRERWGMSRRQVDRLIVAAYTIEQLESILRPIGLTLPTAETQVRPLAALPEAERAEAWAEAVEIAGGEVPTEAEVEEVVARRRPQSSEHPAKFSEAVMGAMIELLNPLLGVTRILDPFVGTGLAHGVADKLGIDSIGVEIEPEWAKMHPRTIQGDSTQLLRKDVGRYNAVVTSPTYGNRMADHHEARDESDRATYRHRLGREPTEGSSAVLQWGDEYRALHTTVWKLVVRLLEPGGAFVLNVKDHIRNGARVPVSGWHVHTLLGLGLLYVDDNAVATRGLGGAGDNAESREGVEHVYLFWKA